MVTKDSIIDTRDFLRRSKELCVSYEQISVMKMNDIKGDVLTTRDFYTDVSKVYYRVKTSYKKQVEKMGGSVLLSKKQKKRAGVLLTANNRLYGSILQDVFRLFHADREANPMDVIVVGKVGKHMVDDLKIPHTYVEIPDKKLTLEDIAPLAQVASGYEDVTVYYGIYETYIHQRAMKMNVTGDTLSHEVENEDKKSFYYFEPDLTRILLFFETQLFSSLLKQSFFEGQLARYASRIQRMEEALEVIDKQEKMAVHDHRRYQSLTADKKQKEQIVQLFYKRLN